MGFAAEGVRLGGVAGDAEAADDVLGMAEEGSGRGLEIFGVLGLGGLEIGGEFVIPYLAEGDFLAGPEQLQFLQ